jgi:hypothetical protein
MGDSSVCSGLRMFFACPAPFGEPGADAAREVQATQLGTPSISAPMPLMAAARNQGWMHGGGDPGDSEALDRFINRLKQLREEEGALGVGLVTNSAERDR